MIVAGGWFGSRLYHFVTEVRLAQILQVMILFAALGLIWRGGRAMLGDGSCKMLAGPDPAQS